MSENNTTKGLSNPPLVILLGAPGSGKGTQAVRLSKELGIPHISTGDLFRENIRLGTELGKRAQYYLDKGLLGPDEIVLEMLFTRAAQPDYQHGFVLDGFPRNMLQVDELEKRLKNFQQIVVQLNVRDSTIIDRVSGRLLCKNCGTIYHRLFAPSKKQGICDICGGELYQRTDDTLEVIEERLKIYHMQTAPILSFYQKKDVLREVNGECDPDEVAESLRKMVKINSG